MNRWIYSGQLTPVAELDSAGNVISRFVGGYMIKNGTMYQLVTDHLGSVRLVVDVATGTVAQRIDYNEYGNVIYDSNSDFQPFAYAGGLYDNQTKLIRFGARDYDAETGRWTNKDPIGFGGGVNIYGYVLNDPINYFDPSGFGGKDGPKGFVKSTARDYGIEAFGQEIGIDLAPVTFLLNWLVDKSVPGMILSAGTEAQCPLAHPRQLTIDEQNKANELAQEKERQRNRALTPGDNSSVYYDYNDWANRLWQNPIVENGKVVPWGR